MNQNNLRGIVIEYYADPTRIVDDHTSEPLYLTEIRNRRFDNVFEAIKFLQECNAPLTNIGDVLPLPKMPKGFKFVLPERNIKIKHQATSSIDSTFERDDIDWG